MRLFWRWVRRLFLVIVLVATGLISPILYVETQCQGQPVDQDYASLIPDADHRTETRTFLTYPEWHIVHAYDEYARVITEQDPHAFGFLRAITQYWSSLCALSEKSAAHGGVDGATKQMVYVIGSSFTFEMLMKGAYEETIGRMATVLRGTARAQSDDLSAEQAAAYARFLQQVAWYQWPFRDDADQLANAQGDTFRDKERRFSLGIEYRVKAAYADAIASAVSQVGPDELTLKLVLRNVVPTDMARYENVTLIDVLPQGLLIQTPRYRILSNLLLEMATDGIDFVDIAGNDDIMFTAVSQDATHPQAFYSFARQGYGDHRHLITVKVTQLAETLRALQSSGLTLEHIHDY